MKHSVRTSHRSSVAAPRSWWALPAAALATLLALPVNAGIEIPGDPLTTGARVAPNILFVLDDSGSMAFDYMPDDLPRINIDATNSTYSGRCSDNSGADEACYANNRNTLAYNPATTYETWMKADGTRMTGGTSYNAVYASFNRVGGGTIDLADSNSCRRYNYNQSSRDDEWNRSGGTLICGGVQTYYVLRDPARAGDNSYASSLPNYYRYQIVAGNRIERSESLDRTPSPATGTVRGSGENTHTFPSIAANEFFSVDITSTSRSSLYSLLDPDGDEVCSGQVDGGNTATCEVGSSESGVYKMVMRRWNNANSDATYRLSALDWSSPVQALPNAGRTLSKELENYATWYSYHRTRMKAAKAGVSQAFAPLGNRVRVGFHTIHERNQLDIPVEDGNDGRFVDNIADPKAGTKNTTSRSQWYVKMQAALAQSVTPLLPALNRAGRYFEKTDESGPYGPQSGDSQFTCRQNFTILTTDGYWNSGSVSHGNVDGEAGSEITGPNGQRYQYKAASPYKDGYSNTLADVAMHYWKRDLRDDMTNNVPTSSADPAFWQHMVTFGISIGLAGTSGWRSVDAVPANASWEDPTDAEDSDRIDDLLHAAVNGRGAFVSAAKPDEFTAGLQAALAAINRRTSSYSSVAVNAGSFNSDTQVFSATYVAGEWTGALRSINLKTGATSWTSSLPTWTSRNILTFDGSKGEGATFPTSGQQTLLARGGGPANYEVSGAANANYLKGDQGLEGGGLGELRERAGLLGDIVNSSPVYVKNGATETLYVGANDGMLHAFDAADGKELFAYVPNLLDFSKLANLSRGDYTHHFFVDGPVVVSPRTWTPGKNLLVGSLGRGGKGLFGLDVTNPASFGAGNVLWERGDTPGGHMGLVVGKPVLAEVGTGTKAVILGNGPNSSSERAVLIVLNLETGAVLRQIDTGVGSEAAPNGLFKPTVILGPDRKTAQTAYAGDMQGNLWKFNLVDGTFKKLFGTGGQPITGGIATALHPLTRQRWVFFGTGRFITAKDATPPYDTQAMYGFADTDALVETDSDLQEREIDITKGTSNGYPVRGFQASTPLPSGKKGWYVELPEDGERIVQDAQVDAGYLITASMIPSNDGCGADGRGYINAVDAFTGTTAPNGSYFDLGDDGSTSDDTVSGRPTGSVDFGVGMPTLPSLLRNRLVVGGSSGDSGGTGGGIGEGALQPSQANRRSWTELRRD